MVSIFLEDNFSSQSAIFKASQRFSVCLFIVPVYIEIAYDNNLFVTTEILHIFSWSVPLDLSGGWRKNCGRSTVVVSTSNASTT